MNRSIFVFVLFFSLLWTDFEQNTKPNNNTTNSTSSIRWSVYSFKSVNTRKSTTAKICYFKAWNEHSASTSSQNKYCCYESTEYDTGKFEHTHTHTHFNGIFSNINLIILLLLRFSFVASEINAICGRWRIIGVGITRTRRRTCAFGIKTKTSVSQHQHQRNKNYI